MTRKLCAGLGVLILFACVWVARTGAQGHRHPFFDRSDTGQLLHILPTPDAVRLPWGRRATDAPVANGTAVYPPSHGSGNLIDHGGPQMSNADFRAIYWNASVANATATSLGYATVKDQIDAFVNAFSDGAPWDNSATDDYTIIQQYGSRNPISALLPNAGYRIGTQTTRSFVFDSTIRSYLVSLFNSGQEAALTNRLYGVYLPHGMNVFLQFSLSCSSFCGYHGSFSYNGTPIKYAVFPYTDCTACSVAGKSVTDILTIVTSHEIREAVTDPQLNAWYDSSGYEADDKCAWHNLYQMTNGGFWVQPEYSNGGTVGGTTYPGPGCVVPNR